MKVVIETIVHSAHRPEAGATVGDWQFSRERSKGKRGRSEEVLTIRVSALGDWRKEMCVAYHEMFEALACKQAGIDEKAVDAFDSTWQEHDGMDEPGDDPGSPYYREHQGAMVAERHLANYLDVNWAEYGKAAEALFQEE